MDEINQNLNEIAKEFGYEYNESFFSHLKYISKPNNQICNKEIFDGEGDWKCLDCQLDSSACLCNDCYNKSKNKHVNHRVIFNSEGHGYCDCGDSKIFSQQGFCPDHKGLYTNARDLMNFIKSSIDESILNHINSILNQMILLLINKIKILSDKSGQEKSNENELFGMIDEIIIFINNIKIYNLSLFYFITLKFTENFPYETNHKCFRYNESNNSITIVKESKEKHICICPFFQVLIYVLSWKKTIHDSEEFYSLFIHNIKIK